MREEGMGQKEGLLSLDIMDLVRRREEKKVHEVLCELRDLGASAKMIGPETGLSSHHVNSL